MPRHLILLYTADFYSLTESLQQEVYREYYMLVYPMVYAIIRDHGAAEDIIQDAFMRAIERAKQIEEPEKLAGWLKTLTKNFAISFLRKWSRQRDELLSDDVFLYKEVSSNEIGLSVEKEVEIKMMKEAISRYLDQLKPEYRQIMEMRWIYNLSYKEMADVLGLTEGSIRQKLFRAREAVKNKLKEEWGNR
ncbi:RNA polymerase sigma factor [Paenibacillus sp. J2TS4]|uniref:RNA polymerase sigma factor n=1 Tax=Paenibacillus sp. J2TS4 TaxID=2807194 RepID=UPI001B00A609|nr:RNA polymerase sigma factor [Paenibacillus sp. J2TS4]GIP31242.1 RNA polymerase sigma factor [Paenibacillus sp. J2TS4]